MPDNRTKREKIEEWLRPNSGKTEVEKELAREMLARMPADPPKEQVYHGYEAPTGEAARPAGRPSAFYQAYRDAAVGPDEPIWVEDDVFFAGASRRMGNMSERFKAFQEEIFSNFSREEQDAIERYMRGTISKQELFDILHKERPRGT